VLFSSYEFIFLFLPLALAGYFSLRLVATKSVTLLWLIGASLTFYVVWDPWNLLVLFSSIAFNFSCGTYLAERARARKSTGPLLTVGIAFNLALIGYFKYAGFFAANVNAVFGTDFPVLNLVLPLAISFFTFQEIAYLVDSSRGETYGYRFKDYVLMVVFFPHLIAGPIVNHRILMRQFMSKERLRITAPTFALGIGLFVFGLAKKVLFADGMAPRANLVFDAVAQGGSPGFADTWIGALAYTLQLYFDFSGYSDMAIGLGLLFGVRLPLNFNSPYKATNIVDFWRRWHMSLSAFLRDYLYFSLGGNHRGEVRRYANLVITMVLGGLWHGAGWTFVCWGAFHGLGLMICHLWTRVFGAANRGGGASRSWVIAARSLTLLFVVFGWVMFRADSMESATKMMGTMIGLNGFDLSINSERQLTALATLASIATLMAIALFAPNSQQWLGYDPQRPIEEQPSWATRFAAYPLHGAAVGCLLVFTLTQMSAVQSFLYFQF
jgi:D-alanyl-lipoteichoic acid acyltransferase DltB (MBOAT superfamily)